jgi:hypothetical protein
MIEQCPRCGAEDYDTYKNHWADGYKFEPFCECRCGATWDLESEIEDKPKGGNQMKDTIEMAREAGVSIRGHYDEAGSTPQELERLVELARADEREACAKVCEDLDWSQDSTWQVATIDCAEAIRARGETK